MKFTDISLPLFSSFSLSSARRGEGEVELNQMRKVKDISLPLRDGMVVWPGDVRFSRKENKTSAIVSKLTMSTHHGTHVDAPRHFLFSRGTVDKIALDKLIGQCQVVEVRFSSPGDGEGTRERSLIKLRDLVRVKIKPHDKLLFKTCNSKLLKLKKFTSDYVSLSLAAAKFLAKKKVDLVGIDYYGIEAKSAPGHPVHKVLLRAGIVVVEGLDLAKVKPGNYNLVVLPLKIVGSDGSPARAILWK